MSIYKQTEFDPPGTHSPQPATFSEAYLKKYAEYIKLAPLKIVLEGFYIYIGYATEFAVEDFYRRSGIKIGAK